MNYLISGAGSGIGRAIAIKLASRGNNCILLGRNEDNLKDTLSIIAGDSHAVLSADITSKTSLQKAMEYCKFQHIDGIIANAGVGGPNQWGNTDRWDEIVNTNLTGTYNYVNTFLPLLQKSPEKYRHIIIISSSLARMGVVNYSAYSASKAGLLGLMRTWAVQYATENTLVNAICPRWINTSMMWEGIENKAREMNLTDEEYYSFVMQGVPLGKISQPEEVADLAFYLLNQQSITGQTIDINNGSLMNS